MDEGQTFLRNLLSELEFRGLSEAEVSVKAGLNRRAVTDLREGKVKSPKISTVFALSRALGRDLGEMLGLGPRHNIDQELADYLAQYSQEEQERIRDVLTALPKRPS